MNKIYIVDGVRYNVAPDREEEFLKQFPTATLEEQVEEQETAEEAAINLAQEDEAVLESVDTDLTSETVLSDYDSEVQKINLSYDEQISNLDVTESDKELYSSFVVDENVIETKTKQLNEQRLKDLALAEQKRNDRQLLANSKNPETSSGRGIHDWLDNESTTETFKSNDYSATVDVLKTMYRDYDFEIETRGDVFGIGGYDAGIRMTAPDGATQIIGPKAFSLGDLGKNADPITAMKSDIIKFVDTHGHDAKLYDEVDKEISEETKRINSIVNVTDAEAAEIEKESERVDLFEPYTEDVAIYGGGPTAMGDFMIQETKQVVVNPYEKELDAAEKMLNDARAVANKKRSIDDQLPPATKDEIKNAARKIIYNKKYNQLQDDKWTDYLEENDDEMQGILKAYKAVEEDMSFKKAAGLQKLQEVELADYNSSASEGDRVVVEDFEKIYSDNSKQFIIEEGQEVIKLKNGKTVSKEVFDKYLTSSKNLRDKYARLQDRQSRIDAETDNLKNIDAQFDLLRRDYNTWSKFQYNVGSGFASIGAGLAYGVGKVVQGGTYFMEDYDGPRTKSEAVGDFLDETATRFTDWKNMSRDQYAKDVSFDRAFTSGPAAFGRFVTQEMGQQLPILATIIGSGGTASPYVIGAYAAGEKYMEMDQEDLRSGFERNELVKFGVSAGYGAAEAVFEALTTVQILKRGKDYLRASGARNLLDFKDAMKATWQEQGLKTFLFPAQDLALESVGEGLTQMTQNMLDGVGLLDNVGHAMFSGGMFGFGMSVSPVMYGMALQKFSDPNKYKEYNNYIKNISEINGVLSGNSLMSETSRKILEKKKLDLQKNADTILADMVIYMEDKMGKDGWKRFNKATEQQALLQIEAKRVLEDQNISKEQKQKILKDLKTRFDNLQSARKIFRNGKAFKNTFSLLQETDPDRYNSIMEEAEEKIKVNKNDNPDFTPEIKDIKDAAYDIYLREVILDKIASAQNSYGVDIKTVETKNEAVDVVKQEEKRLTEIIENDANLSEAERQQQLQQVRQNTANQIKAIKDGKLNGLDDINGQQFVILENSIKNDRTSIGVHEPGHAVFAKILGTKDGDFRALELAITEYLSKTDPDMLNSILMKKSGSLSASPDNLVNSEEFVMEFLEQVDQDNIDFKQKKNKRLASLFGFMANSITKEKGFEINFKGETDAVNFLVGLAKKIGSGTLTKQDVADARSSEALAPTTIATISNVIKQGPKKEKVKTSKKQSLEQDDRNIKYRDIFNKKFTVVDPEDPKKRISISQQEYLNYMLVNGVPLNKGGKLTPEGAQLFEDISRDWIDQIMQLSGFDAELAMTTITGPFLNHLLAMNPEIQMTAKNPIAAYMGNYAPFKVGDARKQMAKGAAPKNTVDIDAQVEGRRQFDPVAAEEVNIPEELNFTRESGVLPGSDMYNAILRANELVLGTKLPKLEYVRKKKGQADVLVSLKDVREIIKNPDNYTRAEYNQAQIDYSRIIKDFKNGIAAQYESILYDNIKQSLGKGTPGYDQRLLDIKNAMVNKLSIADLVAMERLSKDKIFTSLDRKNLSPEDIKRYEGTGRLVYSNPKSGPNLYSRLMPSDQAYLDFFKKRGRDEALIKNLAKTYGFDGTMQVMTEQDTIDKITNRNPELNYLVADDVVQVMASAIDRGVQSKLSLEVEREFSQIKNPTANNFVIYMEDKDKLISDLLDTGYNVGFAKDIKETKKQVRSIIEGIYGDNLNKPEITKLVNLYTPLINKFGKQIAEYKGITDFPLKSYIDGSLNADENTTLNKFWNLKDAEGKNVNVGDLFNADGRDKQKSFINVSIPQLVKAYKKQGKTKLDLAIDFILFKGGFEDGGLDRNMIYGNEASGIYDTKKEAEDAVKALEELKGYKIKESKITYQDKGKYQGKYRVGGGHVEVFNKELLEENFGITNYKSTTKDGVTTWTIEVDGVTREVIGPKKYPQETTMDMVNNNMSQQEINGRNDYSDRAWNFVTTYYKTVDKMMLKDKTATKENAAMLMKGFNDNMKGPMRAAGRLTYVPINIDTKGYNSKNVGKLFEYEHGIPSSVMNLMIADAIFGKNKEISLSKLKDSYQVGVITKGFDNNFGNFFKASMPLTYQYGDTPLTRWFNEFTIGGEVTELFNIQTGKIVKESVGPAKLWNSVKQAKTANVTNLSNNVVKMSMESYEDLNFKTDELGNMSAKFKVGNKNYNIDFYPVDIENTAYVIEFDQDNKQGITGSGNAFKTMGVVYNSLTNLIKNNSNVETVEFSALAKDKSRVKLYDTLLKRLGADLGWETDIYTVESFGKLAGYDYELARPEGMVSTPAKASMETNEDIINYAATVDAALNNARKLNVPVKKIRVFDFDDTLATTESDVLFTAPDGTKGSLNAEEFATQGKALLDQGYKFDFSEFNKVTKGKPGPLLDIAKKIQAARGTEDVFVLTARAPEAQVAIKEFLDSVGLNLPLKNITGLGNSTGAAKANWLVNKAAEGYNDFYFADDALQNVEAVRDAMSVLDVKSKVQQAKMSLEADINEDFNRIVEEATGIRREARYSEAKGKIVGAKKGRFKFFIPYSAEDFLGLLYPILPKGAKGESAMKWFQERLLNPYTRATNNLSTFRKNMFEDFKKLKEDLDVPKDLKKTNESGFSNEQAVRVYIWNKQGMSVPGLSKTDTKELLDIVNANQTLKTFADEIMKLNKSFEYNPPSEGWLAGTITTDLIDGVNKGVRKKYLEEWQRNVDVIFSQENLNKLEAAYGTKYVESLRNILERMKQGKNRLSTGNRLSNKILDYINNANGVVMFLNIRSAVLQTLSSANFINWSFNNPYKAGKAFANQKQYWSDFMRLMNSDFLVDRRNGMRINIAENEIANAANTSGNKAQAAIAYILQKGYAPTQFADSFAIALGGATYFRNRVDDLRKNENMTLEQAEARALIEFREKAEESQQSSDPMRISQQQSSDAGRLILAYANTPMQYARMQKRAFQDLAAGRGDNKANVSKIIYYGVVQNLIFNMLQQAVFALAANNEDDDEKEVEKAIDVANGMADSILRGLGMGGAAVAVAKNFLLDIYERSGRKRPEYVDSIYKLLQFSPPISSKISKVRQAAWQLDSKKRRKKAMEDFGLDNPGYEATTKVVSAVTNVPLDRVLLKMKNIEAAMDEETEWWQSVAMLAGWPEWQINPDSKKGSAETAKKQVYEFPLKKSSITSQ